MYGYIYYYDVASLVFCTFLLVYFMHRRNIRNIQTNMYAILLWSVWAGNVLNVLFVCAYDYLFSVSIVLPYIVGSVHSLFLDLSMAAFFCYMMIVSKGKSNFTRFDIFRIIVPYAVAFLLGVTNYWTHLIFSIDPVTGVVTFHIGKFVLFVLSAIYMIMGGVQVYKGRSMLSAGQKWSVIVLGFLGTNAIVLQCTILPHVLLLQLAATLSAMSIYFTLENPGEYRDKMLNTWNRLGFTSITSTEMDMKRPFTVLAMRLDGVAYINESLGVALGDRVMREFCNFLEEIVPANSIFHISGLRFAVLDRKAKMNWDPILEKIKTKFAGPIIIDDIAVNLKISMCVIKYPEHVNNRADLMDIIKHLLKDKEVDGGSHVIDVTDEVIERRHRETTILRLLKEAILEDGFEMHYQPIYSAEKGRFATAEALIRMKETEIGYIGPDEFIPLAEENGMILDIGNFVFRDVCRFISENKIWEKGIDYIEVNLSVMQCMQETLHLKLLQIMDEYKIPYNRINLEITETAAVASNDTLQKNMEKLIEKGIRFALDDFGTGYSNMSYIFDYAFDMIKLDKSMVWSAIENEKARKVLKHTIKMMKDMNLHIVAEGVETQEQVDMLTELGCDYFQGYHYSRPIDGEKFLSVIEMK